MESLDRGAVPNGIRSPPTRFAVSLVRSHSDGRADDTKSAGGHCRLDRKSYRFGRRGGDASRWATGAAMACVFDNNVYVLDRISWPRLFAPLFAERHDG